MTDASPAGARRLFIPEVIQSSAMDCGPASLKALFEGFGIPINYSRLREACQTDVDGTSIDVIEDITVKLGLDAEQLIVPADHLLMEEAEALPAIVITALPNGLTHFVVAWRTHRSIVQLMDPAAGRLFRTRRRFLKDVYIHRFPATRELAIQWLNAPAFLNPLRRRLADLGLASVAADDLVKEAAAKDDWLPLAALDASARMAAGLVRAGVVKRESAVMSLVRRISAEAARRGAEDALKILPPQYWSVGALPDGGLELRGAVILHAAGKTTPEAMKGEGEAAEGGSEAETLTLTKISPELAAAIGGESPRPVRAVLAAAYDEYKEGLFALPLAILLAGAATGIEALLFSVLPGSGQGAGSGSPQLLWALSAFLWITLLLNLSTSALLLRLGRSLDIHLRTRLLTKLPRLGNSYFHSRLKSDLAQRAHELRSIRRTPAIVGDGLRLVSEILLTVAGLLWLFPGNAAPVLLTAIVILGLPVAMIPLMREQDLRRETHAGVLMRFHLDALLGLMPIKAHRAKRAMRAEHEALLVKWAAATRELSLTHLVGTIAGLLLSTGFGIWALSHTMDQGGRSEFKLLIVFWILKLPLLSQSLAGLLRQLPGLHNRLGRLFDVLSGPEEAEAYANRGDAPAPRRGAPPPAAPEEGVRIEMRGVEVQAGGHQILSGVDLEIRPGEHVAIVGPSGSGKTSFVGLLLGWHRASAGSFWINGELAQAEQIHRLRRETAWVDPSVQIWNRSFEQNLRYGNGEISGGNVRAAVNDADLAGVVERLPEGVESNLGEGGGMISGGEGQRVRFARALLRRGVRLAILDEPFRGLDHEQRRELLAVARRRWSAATLIYVSHDIDTALGFDRVMVVEGGHIVEDGAPSDLLSRGDSRLGALKAAQEVVDQEIWRSPAWRRWWMERGELSEGSKEGP